MRHKGEFLLHTYRFIRRVGTVGIEFQEGSTSGSVRLYGLGSGSAWYENPQREMGFYAATRPAV